MRLEFNAISKQFGNHQALCDVSLAVPEFKSLARFSATDFWIAKQQISLPMAVLDALTGDIFAAP